MKIKVDKFDYDKQDEWQAEQLHRQSPIDLLPDNTKKWRGENAKVRITFSTTMDEIFNTGNTIQVTSSGHALINGRHYELKQFHFHAESEHSLSGKKYPIEAHFVHETFNGTLAVIGVFMEEGKFNPTFQDILENIDEDPKLAELDIRDLIPKNMSYFHYMGSLTTPPLTENVEWYVMKNPVQVSKEQIEAFYQLYPNNHRHTQPVNDRPVIEYTE